MAVDATFSVPLPKRAAFRGLAATNNTQLNIRILPAQGHGQKAPTLKALSIRAL